LTLWGVHAGATNPVAAETFLVLWAMRWSAKLNLFHGVPNLNEEFFPAHLDYLKSYIAKRRWNWLFPVTVGAAMVAFWLLARASAAPDLEPIQRVQLLMVTTTLGLAIVEHWFLVLPIPDQKLWSWAESRRGRVRDEGAMEPLAAAPLIQPKSTPVRQL
jgi:putative photosynthetic complex assembly protein 2